MHDGSSTQNKMTAPQSLTIEQLREMAARQQQQIENQQQHLVAKEQRLKYLKQQEYQQHQMASEYDRLRRFAAFSLCWSSNRKMQILLDKKLEIFHICRHSMHFSQANNSQFLLLENVDNNINDFQVTR